MDEYLGMIKLFAGNFAPKNWAFCNGQLLPVAQNQALFSLLGVNYGGNGTTTFALPDLRGRTPVCYGQSQGGQNYPLGQVGGLEAVTLLTLNMPSHNHTLNASTTTGNAVPATDGLLAVSSGSSGGGDSFSGITYLNAEGNAPMNVASVSVGGNSQSHDNRPPFMALNYIICLNGLYPSRP